MPCFNLNCINCVVFFTFCVVSLSTYIVLIHFNFSFNSVILISNRKYNPLCLTVYVKCVLGNISH